VGCSVPEGDAVIRTMVRVVTIIVRVSGDSCRACGYIYCFHAFIGIWAEMNLLQVHNNVSRVERISYVYDRSSVCHRIHR
jgi:hypothetical protein